MKLITYRRKDGAILTGVVVADRVLDISAWVAGQPVCAAAEAHSERTGVAVAEGGMLRLLQSASGTLEALSHHVRIRLESPAVKLDRLSEMRLYAPVPRPGKILAVGRNYADHAKETGVAPFEKPRIIAKLSSSVAAPGMAIPCPAAVAKLDFEAELAVIIGSYGKDVPEANALDWVAGYTVLNDLSAREFQFDVSPPQTTFAKSMDGFAPMGPWLVTRDEIPDPQQLEVTSWLNGTRMQHASTADMLFPVTFLIAYLSQYMTLEPGDVIATGTPAGMGGFRTPPQYLKAGDRLRFEVTGVGTLEHDIC